MVRLSLGLTCLSLSILIAAHALGLIPDQDGAARAGRQHLGESLATPCALAVQRQDTDLIRETLAGAARSEPRLLSAAVRDVHGNLLVEHGEHEASWRRGARPASTLTHTHVGLAHKGQDVGRLE